MKKVLSGLVILIFAVLVTGGFLVFRRFQANPEQIVPFPYTFNSLPEAIKLDAPILIVGDRMGEYFSKFKTNLADVISVNLEKPIKIQSMAKAGHGIHRTLHDLKGVTQWPQIVIYHGASEEFSEEKFDLGSIKTIRKNFDMYKDDRVETFLLLYPWLSRIVYDPLKRIILEDEPNLIEVDETQYTKRLETELLLFEQHLLQIVNLSRDRNSLLILTTTPINLDQTPKKVCEFTTNTEIEGEILGLRDLIKANNPKEAYNKASELVKIYTGNADLLYLRGQVAKRLGYIDEAINDLLSAGAYDCSPWRATEIHNSIIRKIAKEHQVLLFDFAKLLQNQYGSHPTFFDEIHPQNLYYDKGMEQLGLAIKGILKL